MVPGKNMLSALHHRNLGMKNELRNCGARTSNAVSLYTSNCRTMTTRFWIGNGPNDLGKSGWMVHGPPHQSRTLISWFVLKKIKKTYAICVPCSQDTSGTWRSQYQQRKGAGSASRSNLGLKRVWLEINCFFDVKSAFEINLKTWQLVLEEKAPRIELLYSFNPKRLSFVLFFFGPFPSTQGHWSLVRHMILYPMFLGTLKF